MLDWDEHHRLVNEEIKLSKNYLKIISLNAKGFKNNLVYLNQLIKSYDVLVVQETWLDNPETIMECLIKNYNIKISQVKAIRDFDVGRPKGGITFLAKDHLKSKFREVSDYIGILKIKGTAIIGVYLPFDTKENEFEYKLQMAKLEEQINKLNNRYDIIVVGDFNADLNKKRSSNTKSLQRLLRKTGFIVGENEFSQSFNYTYHHNVITSLIDHVLFNKKNARIESVRIVKDATNVGDHLALEVIAELRIDEGILNNRETRSTIISPKWKLLKFRRRFNLYLALNCYKIRTIVTKLSEATELEQVRQIADELYSILGELLKEASVKAMKAFTNHKGKSHIKCKPWYTKRVAELGEEKRIAKERFDDVKNEVNAEVKRKANNAYRNEIRLNKESVARNEALNLESIHAKNRDEFWRMVKRKLSSRTVVHTSISELEKEFKKQFSVKITNESPNVAEVERQMIDFADKTKNLVFDEVQVSLDQVKEIISTLKKGKSVGPSNVSNEMVMYCENNIVLEAFRVLLQVALKFGCIPHEANRSLIKPLIKDGSKSASDISNIRPISVSDVFATLLEKLLLIEVGKIHININKQFGFREASSCAHATYCLIETVKASRRRGLKTFACAIDASKAFDKVNRFLLFKKVLMKTNWCIARTIINYYALSKAAVSNDGDQSDFFQTCLGVKQGGCLSPRLFSIYIEELAELIEKSPYGIRVGGLKIDIILYADDVILLSNTALDLQKMLDITSQFGLNHEIKFNVNKTNIIVFHNKRKYSKSSINGLDSDDKIRFRLDGQLVPVVDKIRYLGTWIDKYLSNSYNISERIRCLAAKFNSLEKLGFKSNSVRPRLKAFYYKTYVRPYLLNGFEVLTLGAGEYRRLKVAEGNAVKQAVSLPNSVWTTDLFLALEINTTGKTLEKYKMGMMLRILNNKLTRDLTLSILKSSQHVDINDSLISEVINCVKPNKITLNEIKIRLFSTESSDYSNI